MDRNEKIKEQFTDVIYYSQKDNFHHCIKLSFDDLFDQWWRNKTHLRQMLPFFAENLAEAVTAVPQVALLKATLKPQRKPCSKWLPKALGR